MLLLQKIHALLLERKMTTKKRIICIIFIIFILMILSSNVAFPICPKPEYAPYELRAHIRAIVFDFLSDPASSPYTTNEILDMLDFYRAEKDKSLVDNCDVSGARSVMLISNILAKSIAIVVECNDGFDNDIDGKIDLDDAGCADLFDNDETNCGDSVCESSESCLSCDSDCGGCPYAPSPPLLLIKNAGINIVSFDENGFLVIRGALQNNAAPVQTSDSEFVVKDSSGNPVAMINLITGNMAIKGNLFENQGSLTPASDNDFIVKDANGDVRVYIDSSGNLYLKKSIVQNGNP